MEQQSKHHVLILAGGSGTRFWPMSRQHHPKQFLSIYGDQSLFTQTLQRSVAYAGRDRVRVIANPSLNDLIVEHSQAFGLDESMIIAEPLARNTAPAILWGALHVYQSDPRATIFVLPSDHVIDQPKAFFTALDQASALAAQEHLVTMGIPPNRPETGYGYLECQKEDWGLKVVRFTEKPDLVTAKKFIADERYLWNSGMFISRVDVLIESYKEYMPELYAALSAIVGISRADDQEKVWQSIKSVSIDYGIMEKAERVAAVSGQGIGWTDLGSWQALWEKLPHDDSKNVCYGDTAVLQCAQSLIWSNAKRKVAVLGMDDVIVVDTDDVVLVCPKSRSQDVKLFLNPPAN